MITTNVLEEYSSPLIASVNATVEGFFTLTEHSRTIDEHFVTPTEPFAKPIEHFAKPTEPFAKPIEHFANPTEPFAKPTEHSAEYPECSVTLFKHHRMITC